MHQHVIIDSVARNRLPASYPAREFVEAGGLIAYAVSYPDLLFAIRKLRRQDLEGHKARRLPMEQPTGFERVINVKTAKGVGLTIPQSLLLRADKVIQ